MCGCCSQLAIECARPSVRDGGLYRLGLQLQLSVGAGAVYKVQTSTEAVHALSHVVQRHRKPERAVAVDVDRGGADQGEPVSLFGVFGGW